MSPGPTQVAVIQAVGGVKLALNHHRSWNVRSLQSEEDHGQVLSQTQAEVAASAVSWVEVFVPLRPGEL